MLEHTISVRSLYSNFHDKVFFNEKNPLSFLKRLNDPFFQVKTYRTLPVEIRAIVPENVLSFLEFDKQGNFTLYYRDFNNDDEIPDNLSETIWYAIFIYLIKVHSVHILDMLAPYSSEQPKLMFPFKSISSLMSDDNETHNILIIDSLSNYEKLCFLLYQELEKHITH